MESNKIISTVIRAGVVLCIVKYLEWREEQIYAYVQSELHRRLDVAHEYYICPDNTDRELKSN